MTNYSHLAYKRKRTLTRQLIYIGLLAVIGLFSGGWQIDQAMGGDPPLFRYEHRQSGYFTADHRTEMSLYVESEAGVRNVRLYFRPGSSGEYFFIKLDPDANGEYSGELPAFTSLVENLEYLFLWENGPRQFVRTKPYLLTQTGLAALPQSSGTPLTVFTEKNGAAVAELNKLLAEDITIGQLSDTQHFGKRAGLIDMDDDPRYRYGYFGAYVYEPSQNITYATEGYVNFESDSGLRKEADDLEEKTLDRRTPGGYPNVGGDGWRGVFYRTDRPSSRKKITAVIDHNGFGRVTVTTSLTGRGRYLTGFISKGLKGDLYLVDKFDDEVWTTHDLRKSSYIYFAFEDYVDRTFRALYRIELSRSKQDITEESDGCFINAIAP